MALPASFPGIVCRLPSPVPARRRSAPAEDTSVIPFRRRDPDGLKVLVASRRGQGLRSDDYYHLTDGELVYLDIVCAAGEDDDTCGCGRGFAGCESLQAGTTATVALWPGRRDDYVAAIRAALAGAGYIDPSDPAGLAARMADDLLDLAEAFPVGSVVERRRDVVRQRLVA